MKSIAVLFHSGFGHTTNVAQAVIDGIDAVEDVTSSLVETNVDGELSDEQWTELDSAAAIVFSSPTYMGMASWQFKKLQMHPVSDGSRKNGRTNFLQDLPTPQL